MIFKKMQKFFQKLFKIMKINILLTNCIYQMKKKKIMNNKLNKYKFKVDKKQLDIFNYLNAFQIKSIKKNKILKIMKIKMKMFLDFILFCF